MWNRYNKLSPNILVNPAMLENTDTTLNRNNINLSKAMLSSSNGLTDALDIFGNFAINQGMSFLNQGISGLMSTPTPKATPTSSVTPNTSSLSLPSLTSQAKLFALGSNNPIQGRAEGGELIEYPNGNMSEIKGPSHENGGVNVNLNPFSKIYSDRIKIDGLSIADRNKKRIKHNASLKQLLDRNPYDTLLQKSWEKTNSYDEELKNKELELQNTIQQLLLN